MNMTPEGCVEDPSCTEEEEESGPEGDGLMEEVAEIQAECEAQGLEFSAKVTSCTPLTCEEVLNDDETRAVVDQCETEYPSMGCVCPEDTPVTHPELGCITVEECPTDEGGDIETIGDENNSPNVGSVEEDGCKSSSQSKPISLVIVLALTGLIGLRIRNSRNFS